MKLSRFRAILAMTAALAAAALPACASDAFVWSGEGTTPNASEPANWLEHKPPRSEDRVIFGESANNRDCLWDYKVSLSELKLAHAYRGRVSLGAAQLKVFHDLTVSGGTLDLGHGTLEVGGVLHLQDTGTLRKSEGSLVFGPNGSLSNEGGTLLEKGEAPALPDPAAAKATGASVQLSGLLLLSDPKLVLSSGTPRVSGVEVDVPSLDHPDFKARMQGFLGKPLSPKTRTAIVSDIVDYFAAQGGPIARVSLPPQEITGGVLQVLVLKGKVGKITVEGNRWFSSRWVASQVRAQPGQDIDNAQLAGDMDWLNRNPFRQVDLVYVKGSELGSTDLILREEDNFPVRAYAGFEDSGTTTTGDDRLLAGINWGNVFGHDGQFNYQFFADPTFKYMRADSASFMQPLPWRNILTVYGSYVETKGDVAAPFDLKGFNDQASLRYEVPLPKLSSDRLAYQQSVIGGFDYKRANNNLAFGGTQVFGATTDTLEWSLAYSASLKDSWGLTSVRSTAFYSPGNWSNGDTDSIYALARAGAPARYAYGTLELDRTTGLPWGFTLSNRCTFQLSDANLLAGEQMGFGGYDTIRGYDTRVINADEGYILSTEVRFPAFSMIPHLGLKKVEDKFQFLGFFDYGMAADHTLLPGEASQTYLASAGPGLRYAVSSNVTLRADYGWQLLNVNTFAPGSSRGHFGVVVSF